MPKYLVWFMGFIFCPHILKFRCLMMILPFGWNIIISVLAWLRDILLAQSHCTIKDKSWFMYWLIFWVIYYYKVYLCHLQSGE